MIIHSIKDNKNKKLIKFLKNNFSKIDDNRLIHNYHPDFSNVPGNFFYILDEGRYLKGNYFILENNGIYCGSAGWNPYCYRNQQISLGLTRLFIPKEYRGNWFISKYLLPNIINETGHFNKLWLSFNEYNKIIYQYFQILTNGRSVHWPKIFDNFIPIGKKTIYNTKQYVVEMNRNVFRIN